MTVSLLSSFLIFFISLVTSSNKVFTHAKPNATATDELIHGICSQTRNPSLCLQTLTPLKGISLLPKPVAALGTKPMNMAQNQARSTHNKIWALHEKIENSTRNPNLIKQKQKYYKCHVKFSDARRRLTEAKMGMQKGNSTSVRFYISMAVNQAGSCEAEFGNPPRPPSAVTNDFGRLGDVCSIILAICDKVEHNYMNMV
ncbi:UNVERIFIED_CONTAM: hypothetical protein Sradi_5031600 [Sesamum radiatum]|uniref:Pectinesterase inhibitor domain-containing protein n=1 Tax=Sesamum radiatum TaxID=300843 RepID=A0AAW2MG04_SESRA